MNASRRERIHELIERAVDEGRSNLDIKNLISSTTSGLDERSDAIEYLSLCRERRGEYLNIFSRQTNLHDYYRSPPAHPPVSARGGPSPSAASLLELRDDPRWREISAAYRQCGRRPTQSAVAEQMGFASEKPLRDRLRRLGILDWRHVHALVAAE